MRPTVLLFDIDGTLIDNGGSGRRAMGLAFQSLHGRPDACEGFSLSGMTDQRIARQGLEHIGVSATAEAISALIAAYLGHLTQEVERVEDAKYRLHAGMREAVDAALARPGFAVGLGTGNVREGARIKLARVGLADRFAFGGFGCDHENRVELIRQGARGGADRLGVPVASCRVVIIGDTPKDVDAAKGIGAECIGVGTGQYTPEALLEAGADHAFADFTVREALPTLLGER